MNSYEKETTEMMNDLIGEYLGDTSDCDYEWWERFCELLGCTISDFISGRVDVDFFSDDEWFCAIEHACQLESEHV
jgi:hypothetical protein